MERQSKILLCAASEFASCLFDVVPSGPFLLALTPLVAREECRLIWGRRSQAQLYRASRLLSTRRTSPEALPPFPTLPGLSSAYSQESEVPAVPPKEVRRSSRLAQRQPS